MAKGWDQATVQAAAKNAADELIDRVLPYARLLIAQHRAEGRPVVMATTTPVDLVTPLADLLELDDVVATRYGVDGNGGYDGTIDGEFVWGPGKLAAVRAWAEPRGILPPRLLRLLRQLLRHPAAVRRRPSHGGQPRPAPRRRGRRAPVARPAPRRPARRAQAGRPRAPAGAPGLRPPRALPVRPLSHRGRRAHPVEGRWPRLRQPPELLRPPGHGHDPQPEGPSGALPGQEGGLRRPGRGPDRQGHGRHPGRPGDGVRRAPRGRGRRPVGRPAGRARCPRGRSPVAPPSSTPSCRAVGAPPASPRRRGCR